MRFIIPPSKSPLGSCDEELAFHHRNARINKITNEYEANAIINIRQSEDYEDGEKLMTTVKIEGKPVVIEVDSGC